MLRKPLTLISTLCLSALLILKPPPATAFLQSANLHFEHFNVDDGLSQNEVRCITQDKFGFLWIGTIDGLNMFDGYHFRTFNYDQSDSTSLSESYVGVILADSRGTIWVGTRRGLCRLPVENREAGKFLRYQMAEVVGIFEVSEKSIWVLNTESIQEYDYSGTLIQTFPIPDSSKGKGVLRAPFLDKENNIWFSHGLFLTRFSPYKKLQLSFAFQSYLIPGTILDEYQYVSAIFQPTSLPNDKLWLGTTHGLIQFDVPGAHFSQLNSKSLLIAKLNIERIFEDSKKSLWVSTIHRGLLLFNQDLLQLDHFVHDASVHYSLSANRVTAFFEDREGTLWLGTVGGGLNMLVDWKPQFALYQSTPDVPNGGTNNKTWAFEECSDGTLWFSNNDGLFTMRANKSGRNVISKYIGSANMQNVLKDAQVRKIYEESPGILWLAMREAGLARLNTVTGEVQVYDNSDANPVLVYTFAKDDSGIFWLGDNGDGLIRFDPVSKQFKQVMFDSVHQKPLDSWVITILKTYEQEKEIFWLGTWRDGLIRFAPGNMTFTVYRPDTPNQIGLQFGQIFSLHIDRAGTLWIGTYGNGLARMDMQGGNAKFSYITQKDGLPNNTIYSIIEDYQENLWLSSNKGLSRYNPKTGHIKNFSVEDGLQSNEFNLGAALKRSTGELLFGGNNGFNQFMPVGSMNNVPPLVQLTGFKKFGKRMQLDEMLFQKQELTLSYEDDFYGFEFAGLHYRDAKNLQYAYKMEGFNRDWVFAGHQREASYTNLDPGNYTFKVKALTSEGIWSAKPATIQIKILPPFWRTWWFYCIAASAVVALLFVVHHSRLQRALQLERVRLNERTQLRQKLADDFHDELGHRVTKIALLSKILQQENALTLSQEKKYLNKIAHHADQLYKDHRDVLWELNPAKASLADLIIYLKSYGENLFDHTEISVEIIGFQSEFARIALPLLWRQQLLRIFKEGMHNILKHAEGCETVTLTFSMRSRQIEIILQDDGCGFDLSVATNGNGLKNMRDRAQKIAGTMEIASDISSGARLHFRGELS